MNERRTDWLCSEGVPTDTRQGLIALVVVVVVLKVYILGGMRMLDMIYVAVVIGFFWGALFYVTAADKL